MTDEERRVLEAARAWFAEYKASGFVFADLGPGAKALEVAVEALLVAEHPDEAA